MRARADGPIMPILLVVHLVIHCLCNAISQALPTIPIVPISFWTAAMCVSRVRRIFPGSRFGRHEVGARLRSHEASDTRRLRRSGRARGRVLVVVSLANHAVCDSSGPVHQEALDGWQTRRDERQIDGHGCPYRRRDGLEGSLRRRRIEVGG